MDEPYYKQHWVDIDSERHSAYDQILAYHPAMEPILRPLAAKAPAWMQPIFNAVFWIFDHATGSDGAAAIAEAEKAGTAAVDAAPGPGVGGVIGKPKDLP